MADTKISVLTAATTPLAGSEVLPIVQSSTTKKVSVANLTAGRSIAATDVVASGELVTTTNNARISMYRSTGTNYFDWASGQTLAFGTQTSQGGAGRVNKINFTDAGDIQIGTAAKGVNFTANTPAAGMTSQLFNYYEEGTWTPTATRVTTAPTLTYTTRVGQYTRIGRIVMAHLELIIGTVSAAGSGETQITGLPFTSAEVNYGGQGMIGYNDALVNTVYGCLINGTSIRFRSGAKSATNDTGGWVSGGYLMMTVIYQV